MNTSDKVELPVLNYSTVHTTCKTCVFAEKWGGHQTGCEFARLERFKMHGGINQIQERWKKLDKLVEEGSIYREDLSDDEFAKDWGLARYNENKFEGLVAPLTEKPNFAEEKTYYEILRFCDKCRNTKWAESHKGKNLKEQVKEETVFKVSCIIILGEKSTLETFKEQIASIENQEFKANEIVVINYFSKVDKDAIYNVLKNANIDYFRYMKPLVKNLEYVLVEAYNKAKSKWIIEITNDKGIKPNLINELNNMLNERLERCILWEVEPGINIFQKRVLIEYNIDGIKQKAKDENQEFLIKNTYESAT